MKGWSKDYSTSVGGSEKEIISECTNYAEPYNIVNEHNNSHNLQLSCHHYLNLNCRLLCV